MNTTTAIQTTGMSQIEAYMLSDGIQKRFSETLGGRAATAFINSVLLTVAEKPELQECTRESIYLQAFRAATIRLSVDKSARQAYLSAKKDKDSGQVVAELIVGYRGVRTMAERTGKYKYINVEPIFEGEIVTHDRLTGAHNVGGKCTDPTKIIGRLGYFEKHDGLCKSIYRTTKEIHERARLVKPGAYSSRGGCWQNPKTVGIMEMKDVLVELLLTWGELDPNDIAALRQEEEAAISPDVEVVSVEVSETPPPAPPHLEERKMERGAIRSPEEVKAWIVAKAGELAMRNKVEADARVRGLLASKLNECFGTDPLANKMRHDVLLYLTGYATLPNLPGATALALLNWLIPARGAEGAYLLDASAAEEARLVSRATIAGGSGGLTNAKKVCLGVTPAEGACLLE